MEKIQIETHELFLMALSQSATGVVLSNASGNSIVFMNHAAEKILNIREKHVLNIPLENLIKNNIFYSDKKPYKPIELPIVRAILNNEIINSEEAILCLPDGTERWILVNANPVTNNKGKIIAGLSTFTDITKIKCIEIKNKEFGAKFQHATKMESISSLAGGIAHEFNNALFEITGNLELLQININNKQFLKDFVPKIKHATNHMARLTKQLIAYSQGGKYQPVKTKLNEIIKKVTDKYSNYLKPGINIQMNELNASGIIEADLTQLEMVISSIITNSFESFKKNGNIHIKTYDFYADNNFIYQHPGLDKGNYSCLNIEDNGKGMPIQTINNIFKPFFTTNITGRGLGMAAVYGIVKNHKGWIDVSSIPGKGTNVNIYLPIWETTKKDDKNSSKIKEKTEHLVLIVEDSSAALAINKEIIEYLGYNTIEAKSANEAINTIMNNNIAVAIIDYDLTKIKCKALCAAIKQKKPEINILISSIYPDKGISKEMNMEKNQILQKPFSLATLAIKLKEYIR